MSNKDIVRDFFNYGYNKHDYKKVRELLHSEYYDHSPANARNPEDAIEVLTILEIAFDNIDVQVCDLIEEGELVAGRFLFSGIHKGNYMQCPPTGKRVEWEFLENFRIQNDVITESWGYWPDKTIEQQLLTE